MSIKIDRLLLRAKKLRKKSQFYEAKEIYLSVLESFPSNKEAKNGLLELNHNESVKPGQKQLEDLVDLHRTGQFQKALSSIDELLITYHNDPFLYNIKGSCLCEIGDLNASIFALTHLKVKDEKDAEGVITNSKKSELAKRKKILNESYAFEDLKMKAQLKAFEEHEKQKQLMREKAKAHIDSNLEGTLTIMSGHSAKAFKMLQAYHVSKAIMETYAAVMMAFKQYPSPYNYLAAGSALAFGMAQVGQIRSQKFTARRQGGMVSENKPYMVGEGGKPEIFIPNSSGVVSPNLGGKNIGITFNINAVDTRGFQQLLANERGMIIGMINSAVNQQGKSDII